jgi:hypothetical protein
MIVARKWGHENKESKAFSCPHILANSCSFTAWRVSGTCYVTEMVKRKNENAEGNLLASQFTKRGWHITPLLLVLAERYETHFSAFDVSAQFRTSVLL